MVETKFVQSELNKVDLDTWEDEGGAARPSLGVSRVSMTGTASQVAWPKRIKRKVNAEFHRVAAIFRSVASKQNEFKRAETEAIIGVLENKRTQVISIERAGLFHSGLAGDR